MMCSTPPQYRRVPSPLLAGSAVLQALANGEEGGGGSASLIPPLLAASSLSIERRFFSCLFPLFASQMPVTRPTGLPVPTATFCDLLGETKHKVDISWSLDLCRGWKCGSFPDGRPCDLHLACALFWANKMYVSPVFLTPYRNAWYFVRLPEEDYYGAFRFYSPFLGARPRSQRLEQP